MGFMVRPRRSLLFVPCDRPDRVRKAASLACDAVILDLEDGVDSGRKREARGNARQALETVDFGPRQVILRINGPDSDLMREDLDALAGFRRLPDFLMVPKVEAPLHLAAGCPVIPTVESAAGILAAPAIARGQAALMFGAFDFAASIGAAPEWEPLLAARSQVVVAAAAAGIDAIDSPWGDLADLDGLRESCVRARRMGFAGKGAIHPSHLDVINSAFSPTDEELTLARRIVRAADEQGEGAIRLDGRMVDRAVVRIARRTVAAAQRSGAA